MSRLYKRSGDFQHGGDILTAGKSNTVDREGTGLSFGAIPFRYDNITSKHSSSHTDDAWTDLSSRVDVLTLLDIANATHR